MGSTPPPTPSRLAAYQAALKAVSARTGTPLSSLVVSFGLLHELTAILPIVGLFYTSRTFGIGEQLVNAVTTDSSSSARSTAMSPSSNGVVHHADQRSWITQRGQLWVEEGEQWAVRIGRRYGWFGFEKRSRGDYSAAMYEEDVKAVRSHLAGDVANAVVAYAATKALLPLRIGASLYLAPEETLEYSSGMCVSGSDEHVLKSYYLFSTHSLQQIVFSVQNRGIARSIRNVWALAHSPYHGHALIMGKLHLKRTPEEEAERQQRKRRRKEKREAKKSRYTNHPSSPTRGTSASRKWASDDEDNDGDIHGPPPLASTTSTSKRDTPDDQHRYKPDYDAIRAQLEEERFRERMFSAFDDDERLDSLETRFNDYAHVPDRWRNDASGSRGQLNVGEDDFLQMDPQFMDDEEYAEWVRLGMYRKTHRDEYEEQQREKARKKERKEKEKAAKAEAARLEKEMELERSRRKREKEHMRLDAAKELYESKWVALLRKDRELETEVAFEDIPWPLLSAYPRAKKRRRDAASPEPVSLDDFTADAIAHFVLASPTVVGPSPTAPDQDKKERKEKLRDTMLRFHPDKFEGRVMGRVKEGDKERVRQAVGQVARLLNDLMGDMS